MTRKGEIKKIGGKEYKKMVFIEKLTRNKAKKIAKEQKKRLGRNYRIIKGKKGYHIYREIPDYFNKKKKR